MNAQHPSPQPPPDPGGGLRLTHRRAARRRALGVLGVALALIATGSAWLLRPEGERVAPPTADVASTAPSAVSAKAVAETPVSAMQPAPRLAPQRALPDPLDPSLATDPNDLAAYFSPGDEEPTMAEIIDGLRHAGITTGLAAFNPPGTSPPLEGIAVPDDFPLPEGYVRHHQVTDAGEPIEPILMFSPDYVFHDDRGQLIALPEDRVVPPELAPPGLPIRPVLIPKP